MRQINYRLYPSFEDAKTNFIKQNGKCERNDQMSNDFTNGDKYGVKENNFTVFQFKHIREIF
ncbi:hypothetical protein D3C85_1864050 [compost metagenome]